MTTDRFFPPDICENTYDICVEISYRKIDTRNQVLRVYGRNFGGGSPPTTTAILYLTFDKTGEYWTTKRYIVAVECRKARVRYLRIRRFDTSLCDETFIK